MCVIETYLGSGLLSLRLGVRAVRVGRVSLLCGGLSVRLVVAAVGVRVRRLGGDGLSGGLLVLRAVRVGRVRGLLLLGGLLRDGLGLGLRLGVGRAVGVHLLVGVGRAGGLGGRLLLALLGLLGGVGDLLCDVLAVDLGGLGLGDTARLDLGGLDLGGGGLLGALVLCHCDVLVFWWSRSVRFGTLTRWWVRRFAWWLVCIVDRSSCRGLQQRQQIRRAWCERPVMVAVCGKALSTHDHTK